MTIITLRHFINYYQTTTEPIVAMLVTKHMLESARNILVTRFPLGLVTTRISELCRRQIGLTFFVTKIELNFTPPNPIKIIFLGYV